ncbi:MAG: hypothetical protein ACE15D_08730 [Candidatus Eisenbacteria bacterium]
MGWAGGTDGIGGLVLHRWSERQAKAMVLGLFVVLIFDIFWWLKR